MSEAPEGNEGQTPADGGNSGFTPPASQEEFNRIIDKRLERERAKFGDYDDLKAKADQFDQLEDANKSEIERVQEKAKQAEAEMARLPEKVSSALRGHLIAIHEIDDDDAELFLTATDPEVLVKQAQRLVGNVASDRKKTGNHVPREGATPREPQEDEMREFTRNLFGSDA